MHEGGGQCQRLCRGYAWCHGCGPDPGLVRGVHAPALRRLDHGAHPLWQRGCGSLALPLCAGAEDRRDLHDSLLGPPSRPHSADDRLSDVDARAALVLRGLLALVVRARLALSQVLRGAVQEALARMTGRRCAFGTLRVHIGASGAAGFCMLHAALLADRRSHKPRVAHVRQAGSERSCTCVQPCASEGSLSCIYSDTCRRRIEQW
mmetsp:Transcript_102703/g.257482  ORF Transcript_102703/g.257482 Transcript_102703/m.257482 type:complete len:206 (+) Transcript_102703:1229-1846(+)